MEFGEPEVAIEARSYNERHAFRVGDRKFGDMARSGDAPDLFAEHLGEPEISIGTSGDAERNAVRGRDGKLGEVTRRCEAPDLIAKHLGEPQVAIRAGGYAPWGTLGCGDGEFLDFACFCQDRRGSERQQEEQCDDGCDEFEDDISQVSDVHDLFSLCNAYIWGPPGPMTREMAAGMLINLSGRVYQR